MDHSLVVSYLDFQIWNWHAVVTQKLVRSHLIILLFDHWLVKFDMNSDV